MLKIHIFNKQKDLSLSTPLIKHIVKSVLALEKTTTDEVSVHFVSKKAISHLHGLFFNDPTPTDCISFPFDNHDQIYHVLGEVFVCPKVALEYAEKHKTDPYQETILYLIHGLLHLIGYDDLNPQDKAKMRRAEKRHLKSLILEKKL